MSDLIFNPGKDGSEKNFYSGNQKSKLAEWLIKISGGKLDETKVNYVMIGILTAIILATIIVILSAF